MMKDIDNWVNIYRALLVVCIGVIAWFTRNSYFEIMNAQNILLQKVNQIELKMHERDGFLKLHDYQILKLEAEIDEIKKENEKRRFRK